MLKSFGCFTFLVIVSAIAAGLLVDKRPPLHLSVYFDDLERGINECMNRLENGETTNFLDSKVFSYRSEKKTYNWRFKIIPSTDQKLGGDTCFAAKAIPIHSKSDTWFEIKYDPKTGKTIKICGDSEKFGCEKNNSWSSRKALGPKRYN